MGLGLVGAMSMPRWLPNALSAARIFLVPAWLWVAVAERARVLEGLPLERTWLVVVLLLVGASDVLDGQLARRFGLTTNLGATLDAVADKLATSVAITFLAFVPVQGLTPVPVWLWVTLLGRDVVLAVGYLVVWLKCGKVVVQHRWHGRLATLLLFALVVAATAGLPLQGVELLALAVVALVLPGTGVYVRDGLEQLSATRRLTAAHG